VKTFFKIIAGVLIVYLLFHFSIVSLDAVLVFKSNLNSMTAIGLLSLASLIAFGTYYRFFFCARLFRITIPHSLLISTSSEAFTLGQIVPGQLGIDGMRIFKLKELDNSRFKKYLLSVTLIEKLASLFTQLILLALFLVIIYRFEIDAFKVLSILFALILFWFLLFRLLKYIIKVKFGVIIQDGVALSFLKILVFCFALNLLACCLIYGISMVATSFDGPEFMQTSFAMLVSNISAVIPITPNGVGVSEYVFSKTLSIINSESKLDIFGSSYLIYRIFNILTHLLIYLVTVIKDSNFKSYSNDQ